MSTAYPDFPCELYLIASPNIPSNSVGSLVQKLMSIKTCLPNCDNGVEISEVFITYWGQDRMKKGSATIS
jgi:hypothetical protein